MEKQILTPEHPDWPEYLEKLSFVVNAHAESTSENNCGDNLDITKRILANMPGIDPEGSLAFIEGHCGKCDCRVLVVAT